MWSTDSASGNSGLSYRARVGMVMTDEYDNTNRGACWPAKSKRSDTSPDYTGHMDIDGVEYWVNMWIDPGVAKGRPPITWSVKMKEEQSEAPAPGPDPLQDIKDLAKGPDTPQPDKPLDDDIPF